MASAAQAHLHLLSFPLSQLDRLSSLELALIQFHLDNNDKAFGSTVREARREWRRRRRDALEAGELLEGERPVAPSRPRLPPPSLAKNAESPALPPVPLKFRALAESIRAYTKAHPFGGSEPGPLASNIGSGLRNRDSQVYTRDPRIKSFKDLQAAAAKLGIIETGKGGTAGRDWLRLTEPYRLTDTPYAAPLRVSPPPPPPPAAEIPLPSPLPPSLFHLANLEFDPRLEDLDSLPTHQLLLLQFRDDIEASGWTAESDRLWIRIERVFWRRRAATYERGERWSTQLPVGHPLTRELEEALPSAIVAQLHVVQVDDLPDARVSNVITLAAFLPAHLQFVCATVSTPSFTSHTRTAHLGFRSVKVAAAAQRFFAELQIGPGSTGLSARTLPPSSSSAHWRWMDVRPDERLGLWQFHVDLVASGSKATPVKRSYFGDEVAAGDPLPEVKKPRYSVEPPWLRSASLATEARRGVEQTVRAEDLVPAELLGPTFPAVLLHQKPPRDLQIEHTCDDAWIHRFHAEGYMVRQRQVYLCFSSGTDRRAFGEWVKTTASRYWKKNGLAIKSLLPNDIVDFGWQFGHFSPAWRRRHGFRLSDTAPNRPTVGELGFGRDAVPDSIELGWFPFEYTQAGRDQPPTNLLPPRVALAPARRPSHAPSEPLAARLGDGPGRSGSLTASISSAWDRRASTPAGTLNGGEDLLAAAEDPAFPSVKEEEDAEMKPSAEELRRAEELAAAVRINILGSANNTSTTVVEATEPRETADTSAPSTPLPSSFASEMPTLVSLTGSPPPIGGVTLIHVAEQQAAPSRLRRVTAMELMDFEDELEDFTASVAEALSSSMSPPAAGPAAEPVPETGSKLPIASAPLQDGVDERGEGSAHDSNDGQAQHAVISQHAPDATVQTHNAAESTTQRDAAADLPPTNPTPPARHDLSFTPSFATSNESGGTTEPAQHPTAEGPSPSLASLSAPAIAVPAANNAVKQHEAPAAARFVPNGLTRHDSYGGEASSVDAPASTIMGPVRSHSNGTTRQPLASPSLLSLPVKPSFAWEVLRDNTLW